jgi:DNA-binding CsgD family transcriptional regulator
VVHPAAGDGGAGIVGRESELKVLADFVTPTASGAALVLRGSPGVGKTTLWQAGRDAALGHGMRVIPARPNSAETSLCFVSLADLLDGIEPEALDALPAPQRRGLEVALLRADPDGEAAGPRAMAFGLLNLFRRLAASRPLLVAVDDLQWLDQPTAEMLAFAVRRLHGPSVRFLLAARAGPSSAVERALAPAGPQILELAAEGRSNKEIARVLHVTVSTVEAHLSRVYAKLGVRSRSQLASRLPAASRP